MEKPCGAKPQLKAERRGALSAGQGDRKMNQSSARRDAWPTVSVIVLVYNSERYLGRCVDSLRCQSYRELEIILVDDASTDGSRPIMERYAQEDERIRIASHEVNRGLFQARLTGVAQATGEYIAFLDSDDHVSRDWYRLLVQCALEHDCDMVAGDFCYDYGKGDCQVATLDPFQIADWDLKGEDVFWEFMRQGGRMFSWHISVNKLYHRSLFAANEKALTAYSEEHGHMLMWEDVAFASALWSSAGHFMNVHGAFYYYVKDNPNSATAQAGDRKRGLQRADKYIRDVKGALELMRAQAQEWEARHHRSVQALYQGWLERAADTLYWDLTRIGGKGFEDKIRAEMDYRGEFQRPDEYFHHLQTPVSEQFRYWEDCVARITDPETEVVSFDVFDTLVQRPTLEPADLMEILSFEFNDRFGLKNVDFVAQRRNAEEQSRVIVRAKHPAYAEVTLDDIYDTLAQTTVIPEESLQWAKQREIELELELCRPRRAGKMLFELSQYARKKIVICSDMYLPQSVIEEILKRCGFTGYDHIFISSAYRETKADGTLYEEMKRTLHIANPKSVLHIGDNWQADTKKAEEHGFNTATFSCAADLLLNYNPGVYTGNAIVESVSRNKTNVDLRAYSHFFSLRCAMGLMAQHCFDKPFVHTHPDSDYNADPDRIGYMTLGPHLLALCAWMKRIARQEHIPKIHFVARDGYLPKQAFDLLNTDASVQTGYIRLSRKALMLADVQKPEELYMLTGKLNVLMTDSKKLLDYFDPIVPADQKVRAAEILQSHGLYMNHRFENLAEFNEAIKIFAEEIVDFGLLEGYHEKLRAYFSKIISPGDYIFDVGYSGRPESILSSVLGYPVGSLYIHTNTDLAMRRQRTAGCKSFSFYHHKPPVTGHIREHSLMELGPSTVGYAEKDGTFEPVLEEYKEDYCTTFITQRMQAAALAFVRDFRDTFGEYSEMMDIREDDFSSWFEGYIHFAKDFDTELFRCVSFEDDLGVGHDVSLTDVWQANMRAAYPWEAVGQDMGQLAGELSDLYLDGYFVKMYRKINKLFPKGGRKRELMKRIAGLFMH